MYRNFFKNKSASTTMTQSVSVNKKKVSSRHYKHDKFIDSTWIDYYTGLPPLTVFNTHKSFSYIKNTHNVLLRDLFLKIEKIKSRATTDAMQRQAASTYAAKTVLSLQNVFKKKGVLDRAKPFDKGILESYKDSEIYEPLAVVEGSNAEWTQVDDRATKRLIDAITKTKAAAENKKSRKQTEGGASAMLRNNSKRFSTLRIKNRLELLLRTTAFTCATVNDTSAPDDEVCYGGKNHKEFFKQAVNNAQGAARISTAEMHACNAALLNYKVRVDSINKQQDAVYFKKINFFAYRSLASNNEHEVISIQKKVRPV